MHLSKTVSSYLKHMDFPVILCNLTLSPSLRGSTLRTSRAPRVSLLLAVLISFQFLSISFISYSFPVMFFLILSFSFISFPFISCHFIFFSFHFLSFPFISIHFISSDLQRVPVLLSYCAPLRLYDWDLPLRQVLNNDLTCILIDGHPSDTQVLSSMKHRICCCWL